jgi:hypothetical protein
MTFKSSKKSTGRTLTTFHVTDDKGMICGSINVANNQADDLMKHWRAPTGAPAAAAKQSSATTALISALKRGPRLSRQGVLRGC